MTAALVNAGPLAWVMAGVYGLLGAASVVALSWRRCRGEVRARIASWWVMVLLFTGTLVLGSAGTLVAGAVVSTVALDEFLRLLPSVDARLRRGALCLVPVQYACIFLDWLPGFLAAVPVLVFFLVPTLLVLEGRTRGFVERAGGVGLGVMLTTWGLSHVAYLDAAPAWSAHAGTGPVVFLLVLTELNDVAQFLCGRALGRVPAVPTVSPRKTREGLLGGLAVTVLLSVLLGPLLTDLRGIHVVMAGVVIGLGGFVGDVVMSAVKRDAGVKDASALIPGHGGILDRVDSLTFTAPLFFHLLHLLPRAPLS